ncbi:MAG: bifunctional helix-turn-helix transcriptional regulator/GNAT family N-acetyltransferase [Gemmatimonadales bacterium]
MVHPLPAQVGAVRRFNRFYTRRIGVLNEQLLHSGFTLPELRLLYEIAHRDGPSAAEVGKELRLDAGYLSRLVERLRKRGLLERRPSPTDRRQRVLRLTRRGQETFATLDRRSDDEVAAMLSSLQAGETARLAQAMGTIERLLGPSSTGASPYLLRTHQAGDIGWVIQRHGAIYAEEYGWDGEFEALVAEIAARFLRNLDPRRERCWIAERDGENVGSVFLVRKSATVAQLRLLLVEPSARGLGIGRRLVTESIRFARQARYRKVTLWTNKGLDAARRLYEEAGFRLIEEESHHSFGHDLVSQTWTLTL